MNVRSEIVTQFKRVAQEQDKRLAPLTDGLELLNSGLDSLSFAILVTRLEDSLGVDPFHGFGRRPISGNIWRFRRSL